jgi:hypothetical protein
MPLKRHKNQRVCSRLTSISIAPLHPLNQGNFFITKWLNITLFPKENGIKEKRSQTNK